MKLDLLVYITILLGTYVVPELPYPFLGKAWDLGKWKREWVRVLRSLSGLETSMACCYWSRFCYERIITLQGGYSTPDTACPSPAWEALGSLVLPFVPLLVSLQELLPWAPSDRGPCPPVSAASRAPRHPVLPLAQGLSTQTCPPGMPPPPPLPQKT